MAAKRSFWPGITIGFLVMVLLGSLPVLGPAIGGFIAGIIARGGAWGGAAAGFFSGLISAIIFSFLNAIGGGLPFGTPEFIPAMAIGLYVVVLILYFGIFAFLGGLTAGAIVK